MCNQYTNIIRKKGSILINEYMLRGYAISGCNGPYDDDETEVRNLCHLIIITAIEILKYDRKDYIDLLELMGRKLIEHVSEDGIYVMRNKKGKDSCNGTIGHAWVLEAYLYLYKIFKYDVYIEMMEKIVDNCPFDRELKLWFCPIKDKKKIDFTFNHQLWYAASLSEINMVIKRAEIDKQILEFLQGMRKTLTIKFDGKVCHGIYYRKEKKERFKQNVKRCIDYCCQMLNMSSMSYKENGYHIFNVMAFARLKACYPNDPFFHSLKMKKIIQYANSEKLRKELLNNNYSKDRTLDLSHFSEEELKINIYGYPYNVPGFEILFASKYFENIKDEVAKVMISEQMKQTFDEKTQQFNAHCHDKETISYRVYEYYRYLEVI